MERRGEEEEERWSVEERRKRRGGNVHLGGAASHEARELVGHVKVPGHLVVWQVRRRHNASGNDLLRRRSFRKEALQHTGHVWRTLLVVQPVLN